MTVLVIASATGCSPASTATAGAGAASAAPRTAGGTSPAATPAATSASQLTSPPAGGQVPAGFTADSVSFVSPQEAFVLGSAPCPAAPCTLTLHTRDRGATWTSLPAPAIPVGRPGTGPSPEVWGIRFATPEHGFVFGNGLWETTDGGEHWAPASYPGLSIFSLETTGDQVLAVMALRVPGQPASGETLVRRPLGGGAWQHGARADLSGYEGVNTRSTIAALGGVATVASSNAILVTSDGGTRVSSLPATCSRPGFLSTTVSAAPTPRGLVMLCAGQSVPDSTHGPSTEYAAVYTSADLGAHWSAAGTLPHGPDYESATITASAAGTIVVSTSGGPTSYLFRSVDGAATWAAVASRASVFPPDWVDLSFATPADGAVVHGPQDTMGPRGPGQLFLTDDGGATWHQVTF
jgi:photosystem II stability/assembly factor-like uncharacterized protein